ncbi:hypothetical protein ABW19_dt0207741 [Dactylella cylindrospora]|nr:hypothetical protein ABW19_dt0207741 [Dactylella cylindrospora]
MTQPFSTSFSLSSPMIRSLRLIIPAVGVLFVLSLIFGTYNVGSDALSIIPRPPGDEGKYDESKGNFKPPVASVQHSIIRGDTVMWTHDNGTVWQSVGRHPNRPECWTFEDRFGVYKKITPETSAMISNNNKNNNSKKAILLRLGAGQPWKSHFTTHVRSLVLEAGYLGKYDVIIYIHLDMDEEAKSKWLRRVPAEFLPLVQTFSSKDLKEWIPKKSKFKSVYEQNHIPIQMFMANNAKYDFVYSVESDVRLIGRWDAFLADIETEYSFHREHQMEDQRMPVIPDLLTFESVRRPKKEWEWFEDQCVKRFGGMSQIRAALGVVWGWSRRLTDTLTQYNEEGVNCYYEYFAPSVSYKENLTTFFYQHPLYCPRSSPSDRNTLALTDLGKNDPRLVQFNKVSVGCTYYFVNIHSQPFWESWYRDQKVCRPPALVHPIKGDFFN